jgi:hypothetical protein
MTLKKIDWESKVLPGYSDIRSMLKDLMSKPNGQMWRIAELLGVSYFALREKIIAEGLPTKGRGQTIPWRVIQGSDRSLRETIEKVYVTEDKSLKESAQKLGVSYSALRYKMRELGIPIKSWKV